jgi:heme-degrading monooxygenase HmoA
VPDDDARRVGQFVAVSELNVPAGGREAVDRAFADRLGAVDAWPGFRGLQVWRDIKDAGSLVMISYWDSQSEYSAYMQSNDHQRSHARIPRGDNRPRAQRFRRFEVISE